MADHNSDDLMRELFGEPIYKYTAEDAVRDGVFVPVGRVGRAPVYFTASLYFDGYENEPEQMRIPDHRDH